MTTIPPYGYAQAEGPAKEVYDDILDSYRAYRLKEPHVIYQIMGHTPDFLAASWQRSRHLFGSPPEQPDGSLSRFSLKDKHYVTLAVSAVNNCAYCVRIHTQRLRQLGMTRQDQVELLAVLGAAGGLALMAEGSRCGDGPTLPPAREVRLPPELHEGDTEPDDLFAQLAHRPDLLDAIAPLVSRCLHEDGRLGRRTKHMVAFAVAAACGNDHETGRHGRRLRELGLGDEDMVELLLVVDLTCGYNRYVQGLQIAPESGT